MVATPPPDSYSQNQATFRPNQNIPTNHIGGGGAMVTGAPSGQQISRSHQNQQFVYPPQQQQQHRPSYPPPQQQQPPQKMGPVHRQQGVPTMQGTWGPPLNNMQNPQRGRVPLNQQHDPRQVHRQQQQGMSVQQGHNYETKNGPPIGRFAAPRPSGYSQKHPPSKKHSEQQQQQLSDTAQNVSHGNARANVQEGQIVRSVGSPSATTMNSNKRMPNTPKNVPVANPSHPKKTKPASIKRSFDKNGNMVETVWTCDVCMKREFASYEEALAHEEECRLSRKKAKESHRSSKQPPAKRARVEEKSRAEQSKVSDSNSTKPALAPAKKVEVDPLANFPLGSKTILVGNCYNCDVCKEAFFRSYDEACYHESLCQIYRDRIAAKAALEKVNKALAEKMKNINVKKTSSGNESKLSLKISPLKKKNETDSNRDPKVEVMQKAEIDKIFRQKKDLLRKKGPKEFLSKEELPFNYPDLIDICQLLHPVFRTAMGTMSIVLSRGHECIHIPKEFDLVEIKCRFCKYKIAPMRLKRWDKVLEAFVLQHMCKTCLYALPEKKKGLCDLSSDYTKKFDKEENYLTLQKFCDCLAFLYGMVDSSDVPSSETDCGVYVKPVKLFLDNIESGDIDMFENEVPMLNALPLPAKYKPEEIRKLTPRNMIPQGGVPLLNSLTKGKMLGFNDAQKAFVKSFGVFGATTASIEKPVVFLRCEGCKQCNDGWNVRLRDLDDLNTQMKKCYNHVKKCTFISRVDRGQIVEEKQIYSNADPFVGFTKFFIQLIGLKEELVSGKKCVVFSDSLFRLGSTNLREKGIFVERKVTQHMNL